jgi:hypothetical protein
MDIINSNGQAETVNDLTFLAPCCVSDYSTKQVLTQGGDSTPESQAFLIAGGSGFTLGISC